MKTNNSGMSFKYSDTNIRYADPIPDNVMDYIFDYKAASNRDISIMIDNAIDLYNSIICKDGEFKTLAMTHEGAVHVMIRGNWEIPSLHQMNAIYFYHIGSAKFIAINSWMNEIINNSNKE